MSINTNITLWRIYLVLSIENLEADASDNFKMAKENFERGLKLGNKLRNIGQTSGVPRGGGTIIWIFNLRVSKW